jgi:putative peptidoglycan lipid II flippase
MTAMQLYRLRVGLNGRLEGGQTLMITSRIVIASAIMAAVAWAVWSGLDSLLGRSFPAQLGAVGIALAVGCALYAKAVLTMRVPEARQVQFLVRQRLGRA